MRLIDAEPLEKILHSRCAQCSNDYGSLAGAVSGCLKLVQSQPTIPPPTNPPLTLEELLEMDGEPVWIKFLNCPEADGWALVCAGRKAVEHSVVCLCDFAESGKTWLAYRRKPEKVSQPLVEPTVPDWAEHLRSRFLRAE